MERLSERISSALLIVSILSAQLVLAPSIVAQETRERRAQPPPKPEPTPQTWTVDSTSVITRTNEGPGTARLTEEPVMRIALSTDTRSASISTTAKLLNVSEFSATSEALETARVRIESRMLSPARAPDRFFDIELARDLPREDADRMIDAVRQATGDTARALPDFAAARWRVIVTKQSRSEMEEATDKLGEAGFEILSTREADSNGSLAPPTPTANNQTAASKASGPSATSDSSTASKVKLTARPSAPSRELVAFARGTAPMFHSSSPVVFASSDEKNAPIRFNDKPYRGKIEVFANPRGAVTVVNVIGLEDYVRGVVPNELSYPALEALKAQAIAARTYAVKNRGEFAGEGFDLLPTTRSQVYRGLTSETSLTSQAVDATRGVIATYNGEPINALYTSTCGGRTEDAANIFNTAVPYLRGRECAAESRSVFAPFTIKSSREIFDIKDERDLSFARDVAVLTVSGFSFPADKISSPWLSARVSDSEVGDWLNVVARLAHKSVFRPTGDATKAPAFSTALINDVYGESRADVLLNGADADYLLSFRDGEQVPEANRADVAMLLRDGALSLYADATLRPKENMTRSRALHAIARTLESRNLLTLQKGTSRPAANGVMMLRSNKGKDLPIVVSREAFLFREFGESLFQMKSLALVGGEPVVFHVSAQGEVDYLEVRPANNGASADRFSSLSNWTAELSLGAVQTRLGRSVRGVGTITDLRVVSRGTSRRVIDLEVVGTQGTDHLRGGHIRSALGLKEQLFVIDRTYNDGGRVTGFVFTGRGWGHGVGMCQFGAYGLAKQGLNAEQILKTYYTGIELTRMY